MNTTTSTAPYGAFVLRISLGVMFLAHSVLLKLMTFGLPGTAEFFSSIGYPGFLAYVVFAVETLAGIALLLGFQVRLVSLAVIPVLIGATSVHLPNGWLFSAQGGGWEYPVFLISASLAQALLGAGAFAMSKHEAALPIFSAAR